jgi:hypothetical protein
VGHGGSPQLLGYPWYTAITPAGSIYLIAESAISVARPMSGTPSSRNVTPLFTHTKVGPATR